MRYRSDISFSRYTFFLYGANATVFLVGTVMYAVLGIILSSSFKQLSIGAYVTISFFIILKFIF